MMPRRRDYNRPIPQPPGCDPTNPEHVRSAESAGKARATRENRANARRHGEAMVRFERFASRHRSEQLFDAFDLTPPPEPAVVPPYSSDFMLAQRQRCRDNMKVFMRELHETQMRHTRDDLCRIVDIVGVEEFGRIMRDVFSKEHPNIENRIKVALLRVQRRLETPFTPQMDVVLALMEQRPGENLTACELHRVAGDGMTRNEMWQAMRTLMDIDLLKPSVLRACAACGKEIEAPFSVSNPPQQ